MTVTSLYASNGGKPKFEEFITPIGTAIHAYHDKPQIETDDKTKKPILDDEGIPKAAFKVTLMWPKTEMNTTLIALRTLAATVRDQAWGPDCAADAWLGLQAFLRDGDNPEHNTMKREYLFNNVYLNFKAKASPIKDQNNKHTGGYSGKPGLIGPSNEDLFDSDFYAGCKARVSGILFGTEYMGKRFISSRLNNIQKAADGERIGGGGRPDARSQFDPLSPAPSVGGTGGLGNIL